MTTIKRFEDLICWQKCRELANFIFTLTDRSSFRDLDLKRQIRRAAVSPMSNIAEGFDRGTQAEFIDALYIAKGEVAEVRSQLYLSYDRKYATSQDLRQGLALTDGCSRLIQSFADRVKAASFGGMQFKRVRREDPLDAILKEHAPEVFKKLHPDG